MTAEALARDIIERLRANAHQALMVGGCVRDMLLGRPAKDFDVATSATPPQVAALFPGSELIGAHFGVVQVRREGAAVEVATFRSDHDYQDGRHPGHVHFETDPREDVLRRDFTINALLFDPATDEVIDYVGGEGDLRAGVVRTVGDSRRRFAEDHLRMLRAIRFAARLGFVIEDETMRAIRELAPKVLTVSAERIRDELARILTEGGARRGFELLDESGLLEHILPEIAAMKGIEQPPEFHPEGDVWVHTLIMLESMGKPPLTLALGVLLHDVAKPPTFRIADRIRFDGHAELGARMTEEIMTRLRFSHHEIEHVKALVANHMKFKDVLQMKESTLKRFLRMECFDEHLELHRIDCSSSHGNLTNWEFVRDKLQAVPTEELRPPRLLTGADLIAAGYAPGPLFREMLEAVETGQLEGRLRTRDDALAFVRENYGK
ncbi:MAG: CCA tRNA nucleotidyltransferase [Bryobacterales bacterium]|nr:CCA tRNA nucleotidyltransferase [Bryobacterales bacterium]